jgi:superfamily II DNA or RNA helicase
MIKLREYQEQALAAEAKHRIEHPEETRLAIVMATGLGKGQIIAFRAVRFADGEHDRILRAFDAGVPLSSSRQRVLILTHTDELVADLAARCRLVAGQSEFPITVGIVKAEQDETDADIIVASTQTLLSPERRNRIADVGLVLTDECELYAAPQWGGILQHFGCFAGRCSQCEGEGALLRYRRLERRVSSIPSDVEAYTITCPECDGDGERPARTPALGFTATLERGDRQGLGEIWQDVCFTRDISWGVRHGYLVQPMGHRLEIGLTNPLVASGPPDRFANFPEVLDTQLIEALAPEKIVEKWIELAIDLCEMCRDAIDVLPDDAAPAIPAWCDNVDCAVNNKARMRPTVAFMPLVRSARVLAQAFADAGINAGVIHGDMPKWERGETLAAYERGDLQVLVNAMVLTRGWDSPRTKCVIVGRPTKSRSLFVQMAGRGLRPVPGTPVEDQDCILLCVADSTTDLCSVADLSDRPIDRKVQGALTVMEDQWDIGKSLDVEPEHVWSGHVDAARFDPLVRRSSKVWRTTKTTGTPFLRIGDDQYVFVVGTDVWLHTPVIKYASRVSSRRLHKDLPDLELAMSVAEDEAQERGGDLGRMLADRDRPWRKKIPSTDMQEYAQRLGLGKELIGIMESKAGGKAGKLSDLIGRVEATRALEPMVAKIKERVG